MFPIPPDETLVETKVCKHCGISFPITDKDMEFYEKVSPTFGGKKYIIPPPTLCPDCRQQRRLSFRNERKLYKRTCDFSGKDIISIYSPDKPFKVYHQDYWWSDKWNPMDYGRGFDFSKSFFEQFGELMREVPKMGLFVMQNENSPYVNAVGFSKNIHLSSDVLHSENVYFSGMLKEVRNCCDVYDIQQSEDCYECLFSQKLFNCRFVVMSEAIDNSAFIYSCYNLENCLFCTNLRNKKYHILNRPVSREEYDDVYGKILNGAYVGFLQQYQSLLLQTPVKNLRLTNTELSTGELLKNTSNAIDCYQSIDIKDCKYVIIGQDMADCMDTTIHNPDCSLDYEAISGGRLRQCAYNVATVESGNIYYCMDIVQSSHCFACVGLRNASYCILNHQYTKEEYESLVPKIIEHMMTTGEWGEFFPSSLSPFGYNETVAQEYFPISSPQPSPKGEGASETENKETFRKVWIPSPPSPSGEGVRGGGGNGGFWGNWSLYESPFPKVDKIIPASKLPNDITKIPDDILNWAIECEVTGKPFRIIPQELEFYRKHHLPIPRRHPDQRHLDRMKMRNPRKLFERKCDQCGKDMITTYSPDRKERVYCEMCYNKEVIGSF